MDIDGWEFIPADGFLDFCEDGVKKKIHYSNWGSDPKGVFDTNYFNCPLPDSRETTRRENPRAPGSQLVPVPIIPVQLNPKTEKGAEDEDDDKVMKETITEEEGGEADKESVSQVFSKKMKKENEFADKMKVDSPKSPITTTRGFMPQNDAAKLEFDDDKEDLSSKSMNSDGDEDDGLNIWKLGLAGIGAICSFGVAAATICNLFFGGHHRNTASAEPQDQVSAQASPEVHCQRSATLDVSGGVHQLCSSHHCDRYGTRRTPVCKNHRLGLAAIPCWWWSRPTTVVPPEVVGVCC